MSIKLGIDLNTSDAENKIKKLSAEWEKSTLKVERQKQKIEELTNEIKYYNKFLELAKKAGQDISNDKWAKELQLRLKEANAQLKLLEANSYKAGKKLNEALSIVNVTDKVKNAFGKLKEISGKFGETLKSKLSSVTQGFEKLGGFITRICSRILKLASYTFVFTVISKGFRTIRSALVDYINTSSELQSNLAQIKGNLITAFQPIWEFILPYLIQFTHVLAQSTAYVSAFISSLFGKTEQASRNNAKSLHDQINASKEASKNLKKQKKNTDDLTKSNKKNAQSLAKFDELVLLNKKSSKKPNKNTSTSGGTSVSSGISFATPNIDTSSIATLVDKIKALFEPLKDPFNKLFASLDRLKNYSLEAFIGFYDNFLKPLANYTISEFLPHFLNSLADSLDRMDFETVNQGLNELWKELEPFTENLAEGVLWLVDKFLLPLSEWTVNEAVPEFLRTFTKEIKLLNTVIEILKPLAKGLYDEVLVPLGNLLSEKIINVIKSVNNLLDDFNDVLKTNKENIIKVENAFSKLLGFLSQAIGIIVNNLFERFIVIFNTLKTNAIGAIDSIMHVLSGLVEFVEGALTANWVKAWKGLGNTVIGILNGFINNLDFALSSIINIILEQINIFIDSYNSIAGIFGGVRAPRLNRRASYMSYRIPYLASGAVIPPNSPFLAMLGDQKSGTNIETPLETMKQAFKEALTESDFNTNNGTYTFVAQLDGRTLFEETVRQNDMYINQSGYSAFSY